jgi:hypothetical protein
MLHLFFPVCFRSANRQNGTSVFVELFLATKSGILFVVVERFLVNLYRVATTQFSVFLTSQNGWVVPLLKFA